MAVHLPFAVHCCVRARALSANSPCASGTLDGNLLCDQDVSKGLLLLLIGISPFLERHIKAREKKKSLGARKIHPSSVFRGPLKAKSLCLTQNGATCPLRLAGQAHGWSMAAPSPEPF